ncbi:MAG: lactate utilization protein C [Solirubrobacteraceae bacterium]
MTGARDEILRRIRSALTDVPPTERAADVAVTRDYHRRGDRSGAQLVDRLCRRVSEYDAEVRTVARAEVPDAVAQACAEFGLRRVVVAPGLAPEWRPAAIEIVEDDGLDAEALDAIDGAVTGCATAIAETGTLVLDGQAASGRRLITLVPDHHICIVTADQIVDLVPEAIAFLAPAVAHERVPVTFISGPSASSDIELSRVQGVHGPRHLVVLIVEESAAA